MKRLLKLFFLTICVIASAQSAVAQGSKSFSKQMNEMKRSGNFLYAEASAQNEEDAKAACNELLKIEITKHLSAAGKSQRMIKDLSDYKCEYLVQSRGETTRVFGYIDKATVSQQSQSTEQHATEGGTPKHTVKAPPLPQGVNLAKQEELKPTISKNEVAPIQGTQQETIPTQNSGFVQTTSNSTCQFLIGDVNLAKWQEEMLRSTAEASFKSKMELKKRLNAFKAQNKIKRIGDNVNSNSRLSDSYIIYYDDEGKPVAFVAPSQSNERHDFFSGNKIDTSILSYKNYTWFQISK